MKCNTSSIPLSLLHPLELRLVASSWRSRLRTPWMFSLPRSRQYLTPHTLMTGSRVTEILLNGWIFPIGQSGEASRWRVCYQRGLTHLASWEIDEFRFVRLQWSSIVISKIWNYDFSWKYWQNRLFIENIPPKCCNSSSFVILWTHIGNFLRPKLIFQNLNCSPFIKSMFFFPIKPIKVCQVKIIHC